jgi:hypothetical protein
MLDAGTLIGTMVNNPEAIQCYEKYYGKIGTKDGYKTLVMWIITPWITI